MPSHNDQDPTHIVAIGASAGGLEPLQTFFQRIPTDSDLAFVVIQHLSPDFRSVMDELLARQTNIPIQHAVHGTVVNANTIYLMPPRKTMTIVQGKLNLEDQQQDRVNNFPIDRFFNSLAEDQGKRSVAIILSGTGSDGSRGIKSIKEAGGLVMVQDPIDAKFDGMPMCAEKSGCADIIAPVVELPARLIQYISHPVIRGEGEPVGTLLVGAEDALHGIFELLRESCQVDFSQYKGSTVSRRLERQISLRGLRDIKEYYKVLKEDRAELDLLAKNMLIGVTRFFRDQEAFESLEQNVIPSILEGTDVNTPIRVWLAGCSTGEEAYSIAILLDEALQQRATTRAIKIFATDVDPDSLAVASNGEYDLNIAADISEARLKRYFLQSELGYTVTPSLRQMVVFATHNLLRDPPFSNCQLAICRNVLIYFQNKAQQRILSMLHFALQPSGYLFLGGSESPGNLDRHFDVIDERNRIYRKNSKVRLLPESIAPATRNTQSGRTAGSRIPSVENLVRNYQLTHRAPVYFPVLDELVNLYVHGCIVLDDNLDVLHLYGNTEAYTQKLKAGRFSSNIDDFIIDNLKIPVSNLLHRAQNEQKNITYHRVSLKTDKNEELLLNIQAVYVRTTNTSPPYIALVFEPLKQDADTEQLEVIHFDPNNEHQRRILDLEKALKQSKEDLQLTVEELETTNEELQSSNEELMAANEELQSTNEELQSVNEELYSVNSEYHEKIEELTQVNLDLDNIIKSAEIGFVFLDHALLIRRFSPLAAKLLNLIDSDLGRPFHHISHSLEYDGILGDISKAISDELTIESEILHESGTPLWVKVSPYFDDSNVAMGCVISLSDISELKKLKDQLSESNQRLRDTIATAFWKQETPLKLLLVDDNEVDRMAIRSTINRIKRGELQYQISEAANFDDACDLLSRERFDVCLVDYRLGEHNGFELVERLRNFSAQPAFIVVSGFIEMGMQDDALRLGIYDMIDKSDVSAPLLERSIRYTQRHRLSESYLSNME
ncbi:CheR family methyltransferase [Ketobacter sp.]|uniref:CheR family methyltransferase n=1 Tax=Ketobacter sp. TaxID=2083498 RepID=UPI000F16D7DB|nr:CheR family methyltransferase [Ketobacter sp.]RLU01027.1 MAG: response regulator [Ketobacter sp.]